MSRKKKNVQISVKLSVSNERITKEEVGERCRIIVCDVNVFLGRKSWCFLKKKRRNLCRVFLPVAIRTRRTGPLPSCRFKGEAAGFHPPPNPHIAFIFFFLFECFFFFLLWVANLSSWWVEFHPADRAAVKTSLLVSKAEAVANWGRVLRQAPEIVSICGEAIQVLVSFKESHLCWHFEFWHNWLFKI